ncbi:hypothetical protein ABK040_005473 [Willaertia magna]
MTLVGGKATFFQLVITTLLLITIVAALVSKDQERRKKTVPSKSQPYFDENQLLLWPQPKKKSHAEVLKKQFHKIQSKKFKDEPFKIEFEHLAFTQHPNEMVVQFHTINYNTTIGKPMVKVATSIATLKSNPIVYYIGSETHTYGDSYYTGYEHSILINQLKLNTMYYYQCGFGLGPNQFTILSENIYNFTTRSKESPDEITVLMYADMGIMFSHNNREQIAKRVKENQGNGDFFIYHIGDISYADDYPSFMYQYVWNTWFKEMEEIHPYTAYMTCPGNHENGPAFLLHEHKYDYEYHFKAYNHKFYMPLRNESRNEDYGHNMWYYLDFGPVRFISFSTETNYPNAPFSEGNVKGDQMKYIQNALESVDRSKTPFVITLGHRPLYSTGIHFSNAKGEPIKDAENLRSLFEPMWHKNGVDLNVVGHVHTYERQYPVYNLTVETKEKSNYKNLKDTIYVTNGSGGCIEGLDFEFDFHHHTDWHNFGYTKDEGYAILNVKRTGSRSATLSWKFYNAGKNELIDSFTINKEF